MYKTSKCLVEGTVLKMPANFCVFLFIAFCQLHEFSFSEYGDLGGKKILEKCFMSSVFKMHISQLIYVFANMRQLCMRCGTVSLPSFACTIC